MPKRAADILVKSILTHDKRSQEVLAACPNCGAQEYLSLGCGVCGWPQHDETVKYTEVRRTP